MNRVRREAIAPYRVASAASLVLALLSATLLVTGCDTEENPLRPYEGDRPFIIQEITQSWSPDVQWVGGRAAAIGVNAGERAALDSTLVWLRRVGADEIESPISINEQFDESEVAKAGGIPQDSLSDRTTYTVWIATQEALEAGLSGSAISEHTLTDTTLTVQYLLNGRSNGGVDADFKIVRNQTLLSDNFQITWTPSDLAFRSLAIRHATLGGFTDLLWHIVIPDSLPPSITQPLTIGAPPEEALVAVEWAGFQEGNHVLWAATDEWEGEDFGFRTPGYAFFQIFGGNF